jgi:anti-sigma-K factor RskA
VSTEDHNVNSALCGENAAPYVLGVLSEQEHGAFVEHLASCAVCREEVAALQVVVGALPAVAPQLSAPPELKQRVMASVREDIAQSSEDRSPARAHERSWLPRAPIWLRWRPLVASGALVAVVVVLAVIAISSGSGSSGGMRVIRAEVAPPRADVSLRVSGGHAQLDISGLPQTPPQRVYEVWVKRSGAPQPTDALFTVTAKGDATVGVPGSLNGVKVVMVTAEPLGGSKVPTSSPVIVARLS